MPATWRSAASRRYERRRPEKTPLHKIISENLESWLAWREAAERPVTGYVEKELRGYLECGRLCFGFARAVCMTCRTGFVVAFSCKSRGRKSTRPGATGVVELTPFEFLEQATRSHDRRRWERRSRDGGLL